jgi:hypothetical protein
MMVTILLLAVLLGTAAAVILIIYLIDRVNRLEKITAANGDKSDDKKLETDADSSFLGLKGKALWDAMCGKPPEGFNSNDLVALKPRYEHVIKKHIESVFAEGLDHGQSGATSKKPKPTSVIGTLRGSVESWLPPQHISTIYNVAFESASATEDDLPRLRASLDESTEMLFSRTDLSLKQPYSSLLLPSAESDEETLLEEPEPEPEADDEELLL